MKIFRYLILIVIISSTSLSYGQINKMDLGVETGPSLVSLHGNSALESNDLSFGFSAGLTFQYHFTKLISFRTSMSFERKGLTQEMTIVDKFGGTIGVSKVHANFDYITLPILVRFSFGETFRFYLNVGPYFGYLLQQNYVSEAVGEYPKTKSDNTGNYDKLDFGISGGLGVSIPIHDKLLLSMEIRNNLGLVNISSLLSSNGNISTESTNLLIGVAYKL